LTILYADTSALAKLYVEESGSERMRERVATVDVVSSSILAWPEGMAMLSRRRRDGLLTAAEHERLRGQFRDDFEQLLVVGLDRRVLELVDRLVVDHPLRSADAVHLGSALFLAESGLDTEFACSDRTLLAAARAERLRSADPTARA
jgi:predicted nucleic acid-binding protein